MTKQQKSYNSKHAAKQIGLRHMLRTALVVGGFACPVFAQSDLTLPAFPQESSELSLPVSYDLPVAVTASESKYGSQTTSQRITTLLGIKKVTPSVTLAQSSATTVLPAFPSTEPNSFVQPSVSEHPSSKSQAPTIFRSTSGKTADSQNEPRRMSIVLASADESLSQIEIPERLTVQPSAVVEEATEIESLEVSLSELKPTSGTTSDESEAPAETLLDIQVPKIQVALTQDLSPQTTPQAIPTLAETASTLARLTPGQTEPTAPDVVKRSPAIQLHIGGGSSVQSSISDNEPTVETTNNFSMSDADESASETNTETSPAKPSPKILKVRIEGEPAQVVTRSSASSEPFAVPEKKLSFDPTSYSNLPSNPGTQIARVQHTGIQSLGGQFTSSQTPDIQSSETQSSETLIPDAMSSDEMNSEALSSEALSSDALSSGSLNQDRLHLSSQKLSSSSSVTQSNTTQSISDASPYKMTAVQGQMASHNMAGQSSMQKPATDNVPAPVPTIGGRLEVGLHESSNIETNQPISGLSVEHPEVCQVLKNGERSLSVVGLKAGQTRIALFTTNSAGERKIEIREVIIAGTENRHADINALATEITKSVRRMYPNSRVEVIAEDEGLAVQGYAGSETEAKKIISLIRRTSLQPVVDRLATYK